MSEIPGDLKYTKEHEWVRVAGDEAVVGITDYAQGELGDIVFVETPEVGATIAAGDSFGVAESVKTVSDLYAPVSGEVTAINEALGDAPELVNNAPYGDGWIIKIRVSNPAELDALLDADGYKGIL